MALRVTGQAWPPPSLRAGTGQVFPSSSRAAPGGDALFQPFTTDPLASGDLTLLTGVGHVAGGLFVYDSGAVRVGWPTPPLRNFTQVMKVLYIGGASSAPQLNIKGRVGVHGSFHTMVNFNGISGQQSNGSSNTAITPNAPIGAWGTWTTGTNRWFRITYTDLEVTVQVWTADPALGTGLVYTRVWPYTTQPAYAGLKTAAGTLEFSMAGGIHPSNFSTDEWSVEAGWT